MRGWDVSKGSSAFKKGKTLKGKSHERWGMKQDLKVAVRAKRQDGNQTVKAKVFRMRQVLIINPGRYQYAEGNKTSWESLPC
jgi:hypothetical protein